MKKRCLYWLFSILMLLALGAPSLAAPITKCCKMNMSMCHSPHSGHSGTHTKCCANAVCAGNYDNSRNTAGDCFFISPNKNLAIIPSHLLWNSHHPGVPERPPKILS